MTPRAPDGHGHDRGHQGTIRGTSRRADALASERPVQLATSYIPLAVAGSQEIALPDTGPTGLYKRLAARGHKVARFVEEIEVRQPRAEEANFLQLTEAQPVLEVARMVYGTNDMPIEAVLNVFPGQPGCTRT